MVSPPASALPPATASVTPPTSPATYDDLLALFSEWRALQRPTLTAGVPDYTPGAMATQRDRLASLRQRLDSFDVQGWPVPRQVDWRIVRAEMSGLDFDHRVLRPWAEDPAFYVTVFAEKSDQPAREGPFAAGAVEVWKHAFPLRAESSAALEAGLSTIPALLAQARTNLTGDRHDLWAYGAKALRRQEQILTKLQADAGPAGSGAAAAAQRAREATASLAAWVEEQAKTKHAPSGIGVASYDWYAANVQLVPWSHHDQVVLMERELSRSVSALALEEQKNKGLPELVPVSSAKEYDRRFPQAVKAYVELLRRRELMTVKDFFEPALAAEVGHYTDRRPLEFFSEVDYRAPMVMRTHGYHWIDLAVASREPNPSPVRRGPLLYNIFNTRTEGLATAIEELALDAGFFDARPRERELVYLLVAQRAARALGELKAQANEVDLEGAARFAAANTPRGWLRLESGTVWFEQFLYLQQPGYGTSYLTGKLLFDRLIAARHTREGAAFSLKAVLDGLSSGGMIPASLLLWELGGPAMP
jgi:hypothetical protein